MQIQGRHVAFYYATGYSLKIVDYVTVLYKHFYQSLLNKILQFGTSHHAFN